MGGTRNLFKTVKHAQDLLENDETEFEIFKKKFFNNSYFMHIEMVIIGLLSDKEIEKRQIGMDLVNEARQQELHRMNNPQRQHPNGVRVYEKVQEHQVNWGADNYADFIDFGTLPEIFEPNITKDLV